MCMHVMGSKGEYVMQVFFDIQHKGELFLDDEGQKFASVDAACDYLVHTVREYIQAGGVVEYIQDMVIDLLTAAVFA